MTETVIEPPKASPPQAGEPKPGAGKKPRKHFFVIGLVVAGFVLYFAIRALHGGSRSGEGEGEVRTVPVAKAALEDLTQDLTLTAEFRPYQQVLVHAKVSGYVQSINVDIGDHLKAGQVLAELEVPEVKEDLRRASAALALVISWCTNGSTAVTSERSSCPMDLVRGLRPL